MPHEDIPDLQRTMQAIRNHLARHPTAADSARGIAHWWLPPLGVDLPLQRVQQALDALVATGELKHRRLGDGDVLYGAARPEGTGDAAGSARGGRQTRAWPTAVSGRRPPSRPPGRD